MFHVHLCWPVIEAQSWQQQDVSWFDLALAFVMMQYQSAALAEHVLAKQLNFLKYLGKHCEIEQGYLCYRSWLGLVEAIPKSVPFLGTADIESHALAYRYPGFHGPC